MEETSQRQIGAGFSEENARRVVACLTLLAEEPTDDIEGKTLAEYISEKAYVSGLTFAAGRTELTMSGGAVGLLASSFAGHFVGSGAVNYLELGLSHESIGAFTVTLQRQMGLTPAQKLAEALALCDTLRHQVAQLEQQLARRS